MYLQKIKNQDTDANCVKPFLEYFISLDMKAYFTHNQRIKPYLNLFYNRNIKSMEQMMNEIRYPTIAQGFINREAIKAAIPKQILEGLQICQARQINILTNQEIRMPNCTDTTWTTENIKTKEIRIAITNIKTITYDLDFLKNKFQFSDEDMTKVPQNPFTYLRQVFKDTAFRTSQYKMLYKLIYTKKLLKICRLVDTDTCERCNEQVEDFKHLLWDCRYSVNIWKEVEKQITERYGVTIKLKYHFVQDYLDRLERLDLWTLSLDL